MKKRNQLILSLTVLILLGTGFLVINGKTEEEHESSEPAASRDSFVLSDLAEDELAKLKVENSFGSYTLISGAEEGEGFTLEDEDRPLNQNAAAGLAYSLRSLKSTEKLEDSFHTAADYGLDRPSAILSLTTRDGGSSIIKLGSLTPSGSGYYCTREGDPALYLLSSYSAGGLTAPVTVLFDRSLPEVNLQELQRLTIRTRRTGRTIEIVPYFPYEALSSSLSTLLMVKPYARPVGVNSQKFGENLERLAKNLRILDFAENGEETGLGSKVPTGGVLYLQDKGGRELTMHFGETTADGAEVYCRVQGREGIVILPAEAASLLSLTPFEMADHFVRLISIDSISSFSIATPSESWEGTLRYLDEEKKKGEYSFQGRAVEEEAFKKLYQELLYLLFEGEIGEEFAPSGEVQLTLSYTGIDGRAQTSAEFYDYSRDFYAVSIDGFPPEFLIGKYQVEELLSYLREFRG